MALLGEGLAKRQWPLLALMPDTSVSPCMPLVPEPKESESEYVSPCMGSLRGTAWGSRVSSTNSIPTGFCSQKLWGPIFLALGPWAGGPGVGLGLLAPGISLPNFYPPHVDVGPAHPTSVPLLPVWIDMVSLIPQLSDFQLNFCQF